jgi:thioredoxin reductase (NADPH)
VFTPLEYGVIGVSEEVAIERLGADNVEVFHVHWKPLKWAVIPEKKDSASLPYVKLVCDKGGLSLFIRKVVKSNSSFFR